MSKWSDKRLISALEALDDHLLPSAAEENPGPQARRLATRLANSRRRNARIVAISVVAIAIGTGFCQLILRPSLIRAVPHAQSNSSPLSPSTQSSHPTHSAIDQNETVSTDVQRSRFRLVELIRKREAMEQDWWDYNQRMAEIARETSRLERDRADRIEQSNRAALTFLHSVIGTGDEAQLDETRTVQLRTLIQSFPDTVAARRAEQLLASTN